MAPVIFSEVEVGFYAQTASGQPILTQPVWLAGCAANLKLSQSREVDRWHSMGRDVSSRRDVTTRVSVELEHVMVLSHWDRAPFAPEPNRRYALVADWTDPASKMTHTITLLDVGLETAESASRGQNEFYNSLRLEAGSVRTRTRLPGVLLLPDGHFDTGVGAWRSVVSGGGSTDGGVWRSGYAEFGFVGGSALAEVRPDRNSNGAFELVSGGQYWLRWRAQGAIGMAYTPRINRLSDGVVLWSGPRVVVGTSEWQRYGLRFVSAHGTAAATFCLALDSGSVGGLALDDLELRRELVAPQPGTVATPSLSPASSSGFVAPLTLQISCATDGAEIYYRVDGADPSVFGGARYLAPFPLWVTGTVKAVAHHPDMASSGLAAGTFTQSAVVAPVFNPVAGEFAAGQTVAMTTTTPGATIHYTTDGSNPTEYVGLSYSGPILLSGPVALKAVAHKPGHATSAVTSGMYVPTVISRPIYWGASSEAVLEAADITGLSQRVDATGPGRDYTFVPVGQQYLYFAWPDSFVLQPVASIGFVTGGLPMLGDLAGASEGYGQTENGWPYALVAVNGEAFRVYRTLYPQGVVFTITVATDGTVAPAGTVASPLFAPSVLTFLDSVQVTMSCVTPGATIRYTTNGSTPSRTTGLAYSGPVTRTETTTFKAMAFKSGFNDSTVATRKYTKSVASPVRWGGALAAQLDADGIKALVGVRSTTLLAGNYSFSASAQEVYLYFAWPDSLRPQPASVSGFMTGGMSMAGDFAGASEGYPAEENGWPYRIVAVDGVNHRLYRTLYQQGSAFSIAVDT